MRVIIYQPNSFGGYYDYAIRSFKALKREPGVTDVLLVLPTDAEYNDRGVKKIFLPDKPISKNSLIRRSYFLFRSFADPYLFFFRILISTNNTLILFNCFEQLSSPFWCWLFRLFKRKNQFGIYLHDPERDYVTPNRWYSRFSMSVLMKMMDFAFYHSFLPAKKYYSIDPGKIMFVDVPHGIYSLPPAGSVLKEELRSARGNYKIMTLLGSIRRDKNYEIAIRLLALMPDYKLFIAGRSTSSSYPSGQLKDLAKRTGVADRVIWVERFLSEDEMAAVIEESDIFLLLYSAGFVSQSGVLNIIAGFKKPFVYSDFPSALSILSKRFGLYKGVDLNNIENIPKVINEILNEKDKYNTAWDEYLTYASWDENARIIVDSVASKNSIIL